jgi:hypothetical protein
MSTEASKGCKALCPFAIRRKAVKTSVILVYYVCYAARLIATKTAYQILRDLMFALCSFRSY